MPTPDDLHDPDLKFIAVTEEHMQQACDVLKSCEACNPDAEIPFDWLLAAIEGLSGYQDYILPAAAKCPRCSAAIHEKTLIEPWESDVHNW